MEEQRLLKKKIKATGNISALISTCTDLASFYISHNLFAKAIKEYETVSAIYKEKGELILHAKINRGIGEAYMGLQQFEKAKLHFKLYYDEAVKCEDLLEEQRALAQLGHLFLTWYLESTNEPNKSFLDQAYTYFLKSMKKCEALSENNGIEKQDMIARLFSNLGLVKESYGDYDTCLKLYEKSIKICVKYDLYEQLYRGYLSMASLMEKLNKYQDSIKHYNMAVDVAKKLSHKKVELICAALIAKSETLIKLTDFQGAKQVLRKAYKLKTPNRNEAKLIEKKLRIVAGLCNLEDQIIISSNEDKTLKQLYEKMGDGACALKIYSKAVEYYKKMLEVAEKTGASNKELEECYYSLAETYKDNGAYKEAEIFYEKEYELCKMNLNLKESLNTICKIADLKEQANNNEDTKEIKKIYERGLKQCKEMCNVKEEKRLLKRYIAYLRRSFCNKDSFELEKYLKTLQNVEEEEEAAAASESSECESEESDKLMPEIGAEIKNLSDITDISEESDNDVLIEPTTKKRKLNSSIKFKRNLNGEWPLHVACIKGNLKMVKFYLISQDHPVNVRDNAGWLPIHEAALHGHLNIVKLLLEFKALINDRGGSECNGLTPLHDAASNGHLEVVELLLNNGASALVKTDNGTTPLYELNRWYQRDKNELSEERNEFYRKIRTRLEETLKKAGQKDCSNVHQPSSSLSQNEKLEEPEEEESEEESSNYQNIMENLRHKTVVPEKTKKFSKKPSALIDAEEFVDLDEWLDEDIQRTTMSKRRKSNLPLSRNSSSYSISSDNSLENVALPSPNTSRNSNNSVRRRKHQITLIDTGFSRRRSSSSTLTQLSNSETVQKTIVEADSSTNSCIEVSQILPRDPMLFVDVEILEKLYRVPVLMSQLQTKSIKWLSEEAAQRYEAKQFMHPILELETFTGVALDDADPLSILFPAGSNQSEKIVGKVLEWSEISVIDRYKETCTKMGLEINTVLIDRIESLSINLDLSDHGLLSSDLNPLFKSLNNQKSLSEINLRGNFLNSYSMNLLCASFSTLSNLETLNLSLTSLQNTQLSLLATSSLKNLKNLDLSDNLTLKNESIKELSIITNMMTKLRKLNISNIGLTDIIIIEEELNLKNVVELNASFNQLEENLKKLLKNNVVNYSVLKNLNISWTGAKINNTLKVFEPEEPGQIIILENINLNGCNINDYDLFEFFRFAPYLKKISLEHNDELTAISLRRLLEHGGLNYINLKFCKNIWKYFDSKNDSTTWNIRLTNNNCDNNNEKFILKISFDENDTEKRDFFIKMLQEKYLPSLSSENRLEIGISRSELLIKLI